MTTADNDNKSEALARLKSFLALAAERNTTDIKRMRKDRDFASGKQWIYSEQDGRPQAVFNLIDNWSNAILNPFLARPYTVSFSAVTPDINVDRINQWGLGLQQEWSSKNAIATAYQSAILIGRGYFYVTTVQDAAEGVKVAIFAIDDATRVVWDPDSTDINGADAERVAVVERMRLEKAKRLYGEDIADDSNSTILNYLGDDFNPGEDYLSVVTFYERVDEGVVVHKFIGDTRVGDPVLLAIKHIPVIPICGSQTWLDKHRTFVGITNKLKYPQMVINYAGRQLMERLARTPKSQIIIGKTALAGNEKYYKNMDKNLSPILPYNDYNSDGIPVEKPVRFDNTVQADDLITIIKGEQDLMSTIVGMPLTGVAGSLGAEETAESILLRAKSSESNISHFAEHCKESVKQMGVVLREFYQMLSGEPQVGVRVEVDQGPETITSKAEARRQLLALSQLYPESMKPVVAWGITKTLDNPEVAGLSNMLAKLLPPEVLADQIPQVAMLQQQLQQMAQGAQQQLADKDKQIQQLNTQLLELQLRTQSDLQIAQMNNDTKIQTAIIGANAKAAQTEQKSQLDMLKLYAELERDKERAGLEASKATQQAVIDAAKQQQQLSFQSAQNRMTLDAQAARTALDLDAQRQRNEMQLRQPGTDKK